MFETLVELECVVCCGRVPITAQSSEVQTRMMFSTLDYLIMAWIGFRAVCLGVYLCVTQRELKAVDWLRIVVYITFAGVVVYRVINHC